MYSTSSNFTAAAEANARQIITRAYINDSTLLTGEDIIDLNITETLNASDGVSMGATNASKLEMKIKAPKTPLLLTGSSIRPEVAFYGVDEWIPLGKFYIETAKSNDDFNTTYTLTAYDAFSKTEKPYEPRISMPNTAAEVLVDIATQCGFTLGELPELLGEVEISNENVRMDEDGTLIFPNGATVANGVLIIREFSSTPAEEVSTYTCRQYIGFLAGLAGANARFDRNGNLSFVWYTDTGYHIPRELQYLGGCKRLTEHDLKIQSITSGPSGAEITAGNGVGFSFENPFMTQSILDDILSNIGTVTYTPLQVKWRGNPAVEVGDIITVEDVNGEARVVFVMEQIFRISGGFNVEIKCHGKSDAEISFSTSPTSKRLKQVYTKLQEAIAEATQLLNGSNGGVFEITDEDVDGINDGWIIRTADSMQFIKANLNGIGITRDGGATYEQAMTTQGLNASAIHTGQMSADRITVGGAALGDVFEVKPDADGHPVVIIGSSDSDIKQKQTNDAVSFVNGSEQEVAKFSITGAEWADMQQMKYCGFVWTKSPVTGNVRFTKAGEN